MFPADSPLVHRTVASPNHEERKTTRPDILLLHYTGMVSTDAALARLCDPRANVSSHYLVDEGGRIIQLVPESRRAYHAGISLWERERDINSRSIGIEIANPGHDFGYPDFPEAQIVAVIALCQDIIGRWSIRPHHVLAHSDVAPHRKRDPGEKFPWRRLAQAGVGLWIEPTASSSGAPLALGDAGEPVKDLQRAFATFGYGIDVNGKFDVGMHEVVMAFQRHFRPERISGIADPATVETLKKLVAAKEAA